MKRGTADHPKARALAARLGLRRYQVAGLLESLWDFAKGYARRGDVGRHTNQEIASHIDWEGDAGQLVQALVATRWLDACACHRLRVHDWGDHADQTVKRSEEVKRHGFLDCYGEDASAILDPASDPPAFASSLPADASQSVPSPSPASGPAPEPAPSSARTAARDPREAWAAVGGRLQAQLDEHRWGTWFRPLEGLEFDGDELRVAVPTNQFTAWIGTNYRQQLAEAMAAEGLAHVRLVFVARANSPPQARAG